MTTKVKMIRPNLGFAKLLDADFVSRINAIETGMNSNPAYPNPPVAIAVLKTAGDAYAAAIAIALDGSKTAIADRRKKKEEVIAMLRLLGPYVESASNGDMTTFLSSGFLAVSTTRSAPKPVSVPTINRVDQGPTGTLLVAVKSVANARNYVIRYATLGTTGLPGNWVSTTVPNAKQAATIAGLTPGTTYSFEVQAYGKLGYSDWSASVERMCI